MLTFPLCIFAKRPPTANTSIMSIPGKIKWYLAWKGICCSASTRKTCFLDSHQQGFFYGVLLAGGGLGVSRGVPAANAAANRRGGGGSGCGPGDAADGLWHFVGARIPSLQWSLTFGGSLVWTIWLWVKTNGTILG